VEVIATPGKQSVVEKNQGDWTVAVRHKITRDEAVGHGASRLAATDVALNVLRGMVNAGWAENPERAREIAEREIQAIDEADGVVLIWAPDLLGAAIEVGSAIGTEKQIYVYRPGRDVVFWYMRNVHIVWSKTELLELIKSHEELDLL
jgi:nucleoside 2-deoxyribosyltransferase